MGTWQRGGYSRSPARTSVPGYRGGPVWHPHTVPSGGPGVRSQSPGRPTSPPVSSFGLWADTVRAASGEGHAGLALWDLAFWLDHNSFKGREPGRDKEWVEARGSRLLCGLESCLSHRRLQQVCSRETASLGSALAAGRKTGRSPEGTGDAELPAQQQLELGGWGAGAAYDPGNDRKHGPPEDELMRKAARPNSGRRVFLVFFWGEWVQVFPDPLSTCLAALPSCRDPRRGRLATRDGGLGPRSVGGPERHAWCDQGEWQAVGPWGGARFRILGLGTALPGGHLLGHSPRAG